MMIRQCNRCVLDTTCSEISFNEEGICNFCRTWEEKEKERKAEKLHPGLHWTINEIEKQKGEYNCLLGLSGGIDSSMVLHYAVAERGLKPLCFSFDNGWNDPRADENVKKIVDKLGVKHLIFKVDMDEYHLLQEAFIKSGVRNIEIPTDHILQALTYKIAKESGIKYVLSGGNHATEGIMPESWGYQPRDLKHIKAIFKQFVGRRMRGLPTINLAQYLYYRFIEKIKIIQLLNFYEYNRAEALELLQREYGYQDYGEKHGESRFTKWFQNFYLPTKFNINKRKPHLSSMINSGQMTKEEALKELQKDLISEKIGYEELVLKTPTHSHFDYPNNKWIWDFIAKIYGFTKKKNN